MCEVVFFRECIWREALRRSVPVRRDIEWIRQANSALTLVGEDIVGRGRKQRTDLAYLGPALFTRLTVQTPQHADHGETE